MRWSGFRSPASTALADAIFVPLTGPMDTHNLRNVRFTVWLDGEGVIIAPGIAFSDDGVYWPNAPGVVGAMIENDEGWKPLEWVEPGDPSRAPEEDRSVQTVFVSLPEGFSTLNGAPMAALRNTCRFGVWVLDTTATSYTKGGRVALSVEVQGIESSTQTTDMVLCFSGGGDGTTPDPVSTPVTGAMPTQDVTKIRFTLELTSRDEVTVGLRWQGSLDGIVWDGTENTISDSPTSSADGFVFPTEFLEIDLSDWRFFRVLARVVNTTSSDTKIRSVLVRIKVDTRES